MFNIVNIFRFDNSKPKDASNDRFILSKGHAAPILYAAHALVGQFPVEDLMKLRKIDSDLEGHPTPRLNFIDVATGSLGQGLSVACGMAYVGKFLGFFFNFRKKFLRKNDPVYLLQIKYA